MSSNALFCVLTIILGVIGGTGLYVFSALLLNAALFFSLLVIIYGFVMQYRKYGFIGIGGDFYKILVILLYLAFLTASALRETIVDSEYVYNYTPEGGLIREYTDLLRGFIGYWIVWNAYSIVKDYKIFRYLPLVCIAIILAGQLMQAYGLVDVHNEFEEANEWGETFSGKLLLRPGGFLNANMTGAIAMIWLYVQLEGQAKAPLIIKSLAVVLTLSICLIAQSRASILFLSLFILYKSTLGGNFKFLLTLVVAGLALAGFLYYMDFDFINDLLEKFIYRASTKEDSAAERERLIYKAIEGFQDSPIFGHGILNLLKTYVASSHNQTLEILNNYGLIGFISFAGLYMAFYHVNNVGYIIICILPTLLFSHNFFENSSFQMSIAFAYAHTYEMARRKIALHNDVEENAYRRLNT